LRAPMAMKLLRRSPLTSGRSYPVNPARENRRAAIAVKARPDRASSD
jgi:hypothetical protein